MSYLAVSTAGLPPATKWVHDIRNTLTAAGLHLDTLERLTGSSGHQAIEAAHALMLRASRMCEQALHHAPDQPALRRPSDIVAIVRQVADLLAPVAPQPFEIRVRAAGPCPVMADSGETFRIFYNLLHNAVTVARRERSISHVDISVARSGATVAVRISDDGPGLPAAIRKNLFRPGHSGTGGSGLGLAIARELAERNGGMLEPAQSARGTTFVLELPTAPASAMRESPVTRSLGQRAARH